MEEEIDLTIYIDILLRWWWLIGLAAILVGGSAYVVSSLMTPTYEASAGVVLLKSKVEVSFGSGIESLTEEDLMFNSQVQGSSALIDRTARRLNTLTGMVKDGAIASQVAEALAGVLEPEELEPGVLSAKVKGELYSPEGGGESNTIQIIVSDEDPETAALIANAWAEAFEQHINMIYGVDAALPFEDIQSQVDNAKVAYDTAQAAWVEFLTEEDRIGELQRQVAEQEELLAKLRAGRQDSVVEIVTRQAEVQKRLFDVSVGSEINFNLLTFEKRLGEMLDEYRNAYERKQRFETLLYEAGVIREQLVSGDDISARTMGLSIYTFKQKVLAAGGLPVESLELQATSLEEVLTVGLSREEQLADLENLIAMMEADVAVQEAIIEQYETALAQNQSYEFLQTLTPDYLDMTDSESEKALGRTADWKGLLTYSDILETPFTQEIDQLEQEVRLLRAEVVRLQDLKEERQKERSLAWQTYSNLLSKKQEIDVAQATGSTEVRFASTAVPPRSPVGPRKMMNTAVGLAIGLMMGVFGAFLFDYIGMASDPRRWLRRQDSATPAA
ncbi:MAG: GumC family protein [Anaerolineales bacterium]